MHLFADYRNSFFFKTTNQLLNVLPSNCFKSINAHFYRKFEEKFYRFKLVQKLPH